MTQLIQFLSVFLSRYFVGLVIFKGVIWVAKIAAIVAASTWITSQLNDFPSVQNAYDSLPPAVLYVFRVGALDFCIPFWITCITITATLKTFWRVV